MSEILIGTSGYDHPELKGIFYPEKMARKDFLEYYSTRFNALELNSTFYGMPTVEKMNRLLERTEGRLKFSIKCTRVLTHEIDVNWKNRVYEFVSAVDVLAQKDLLKTVLIQFPESFGYTDGNRIYLGKLLREFGKIPCCVEFRHRDWIRPSVFEGLEKFGAGIVFCDMPQLANLPDGKKLGTPFIGKNAYIRLHGRNERGWYVHAPEGEQTSRYDYCYSEDELIEFVPVVYTALSEGRDVMMFFNNHPKGDGFKNGLRMMELLGVKNTGPKNECSLF